MLYNNVNNSSWLQISMVSKTTLFLQSLCITKKQRTFTTQKYNEL